MTISVTLSIVASPEQVGEFIEQHWPGRKQPEIKLGEEFAGRQTADLVCFDPDWGYWAQRLEDVLREEFPRASQCLYCGHEWVEQPDEDADVCPDCGEDLTEW